MRLIVNGKEQEYPGEPTVAALIEQRKHKPRTVAVALNEEFVPRSRHAETMLSDGDRIEIVAPMQGG